MGEFINQGRMAVPHHDPEGILRDEPGMGPTHAFRDDPGNDPNRVSPVKFGSPELLHVGAALLELPANAPKHPYLRSDEGDAHQKAPQASQGGKAQGRGYHRRATEPQVSPAPNATVMTRLPRLMRPALAASSIASGMLAADVFP